MSISIEEIVARIKNRESLSEISLSLLPEAMVKVLRRCAAVRWFDQDLFHNVLRGRAFKEVTFEKIISLEYVEPVPRTDRVYRVKDHSRIDLVKNWWKTAGGLDFSKNRLHPPHELLKLFEQLVKYFRAQGATAQIDLLYHLIFVDAEKARILFQQLFQAADRDFDQARCMDLIRTVREFSAFLYSVTGADGYVHWTVGADFWNAVSDAENYIKTRVQWSNEYYQTIQYLERKKQVKSFERFLQDKKKWIWQIYGMGGMGKTMLMRWLIARRAIPDPYRYPCAKIDFDYFPVRGSSWDIYRLLFSIMEQLTPQLPNSAVGDIFDKLKDVMAMLDGPSETESSSPVQERAVEPQPPDNYLSEMLGRLPHALASTGKPVIVIFDTLEEVILHTQLDLLGLIARMEEMHRSYDGIRLVLAGRYDLQERLPEFASAYGEVTEKMELEPFTAPEARKYLVTKRELAKFSHLAEVIKKAAGNPLTLALYADLIRSRPDISKEEILKYDATLVYLVRRVLQRIKIPRVQWVLRYGVIPRQLTFDYLKEVMKKYLPPAISGRSTDDPEPRKDLPEKLQSEDLFNTDATVASVADLDLEMLWKDLRQYASKHTSWVSLGSDQAILIFHPDVIQPMRYLLQKKRIFQKLHNDSIRYFEKKAKNNPKVWDKWIEEAIYHKFQLAGDAAVPYWQQQLAQARGNFEWQRNIARAITGRAFVDEEDRPRQRRDGEAIVTYDALLQAYYESAFASAMMAYLSINDRAFNWSQATLDINRASAIKTQNKFKSISESQLELVRAAVLWWQRDDRLARASLASVRKNALTKLEQLFYHLMEAELAVSKGGLREPGALAHYQAALALAKTAPVDLQLKIRREIAHIYSLTQDYTKARESFQQTIEVAQAAGNGHEMIDAFIRLIFLEQESGQLAEAEEQLIKWQDKFHLRYQTSTAQNVDTNKIALDPFDEFRFYESQARFMLALKRPLAVNPLTIRLEQIVHDLRRKAKSKSERDTVAMLLASYNEVKGLLYCELTDYASALQRLDSAISHWKAVGATERILNCHLKKIEICLYGIGDLKQTDYSLDRTTDLLTKGSYYAGIAQLYKAALRYRQANIAAAHKLLDEAIEAYRTASPTVAIRCGVERILQNADKQPDRYLKELIALMEKVSPASACFMFIDSLRYCPYINAADKNLLDKFAQLFPKPNENDATFVVMALKLVEVYRVTGKTGEAIKLLQQIERHKRKEQNIFLLREVWKAWDRLNWQGAHLTDNLEELNTYLRHFDGNLNLCWITLIEHSYRILVSNLVEKIETAKTLIDRAKGIPFELGRSQWLARYEELLSLFYQRTSNAKLSKQHHNRALSLYKSIEDRVAIKYLSSQNYWKEWETGLDWNFELKLYHPAGQIRSVQPPAKRVSNEIKIRMEVGNQAIRVNTALPRTKSRDHIVSLRDDTLIEKLLSVKQRENFSYDFFRLFADDHDKVLAELAELVLSREAKRLLKQPVKTISTRPDLRLEIKEKYLAAIPWELLPQPKLRRFISASTAVRYFYRTTPHQFIDIESLQPLKKPVNVLMVSGEMPTQWGNNEFLDEEAGQVTWLPNKDIDAFKKAIKTGPDIIHIYTPIKESPSLSSAYLKLNIKPDLTESNILTPLIFNDIMGSYPEGKPQPILILEVESSRHDSIIDEILRKLFLRNVIASELYAGGNLRAIIATGPILATGIDLLINLLLQNYCLGECVKRYIKMDSKNLSSFTDVSNYYYFTLMATALFTQDPTIKLFGDMKKRSPAKKR